MIKMHTSMLPKSLRTRVTEAIYQQAKLDKTLRPLETEPRLKEWKYWFLIENRFPYDEVFKLSHMLVIKRDAGEIYDLTLTETHELLQIRKTLSQDYDAIMDNLPHRRSVTIRYHVHLVKM